MKVSSCNFVAAVANDRKFDMLHVSLLFLKIDKERERRKFYSKSQLFIANRFLKLIYCQTALFLLLASETAKRVGSQ
jgi:hypothetical protein